MHPAHLTTPDMGTHEITRVFYYDGTFKLGGSDNRIGPGQVLRASYEVDGPITLVMVDGKRLIVPSLAIGSVTYTLE